MKTAEIGAETASYTWSFPICPHSVNIDFSVIRALQYDVSEPSEIQQGLLFGKITSTATYIEGYAPLPTLEQAEFVSALEHVRRAVVGYYRIRDGRAFILNSEEISIAKEVQRAGAVVLLIERRAKGPAEGTFCFWRGDSLVTNLPLPFPIDPVLLGGDADPASAAHAPESGRKAKAGRKHARFAVGQMALVGAGVVGGIVLGSTLLHSSRKPSPPAAAVPSQARAAASELPPELRGQLEITWNPQEQAVAGAAAGQLNIDDGGVKRLIPLNAVELGFGSVLYSPVTDHVDVELTTRQKDGRTDKLLAIARPFVPVAPPPPPAVEQPAPPPPAKEQPPARQSAAVVEPPPAPKETKPAAPTPTPIPAKRFTWNAADREAPKEPAVLDAPALPVQVAGGAQIPLAPSFPGPSLPPLRQRPTTSTPVATTPHSGRMIWTGTLSRRGVVELDGHTVSIGALSGGLPGVPVNVTISPAEFADHGLVVYTTDPKRHNRVEAPNAGNGWNQIKYIWDPERVRQVEVLEAPNPSNKFSRLAVRSDARRCSMMLIDWVTK